MPTATLVQVAPASPACDAASEIRHGRKPQRAVTAGALILVTAIVLIVLPVVGVVLQLEALLTWIAAVDCEILIPLATIALIRVTCPHWARSAADGTSLGTVLG